MRIINECKIFVILGALLLVTTNVFSQIPLGFKAGGNVNFLSMKDLPNGSTNDAKSHITFHLGVYTKLKLANKLFLVPELQFIQKGFSYDDPTSPDETITKITYLELPVLISYQVIKRVHIEVGPSMAINLGAISKSGDFKNDVDFNSTDIGINAGLRVNITKQFSLLSRYYKGFSSISDIYFDDGIGNRVIATWYISNFQVSLAYYLRNNY